MSVLECRDIRKTFREGRHVAEILKGISLAVEPGEVVGLEGPSGSGKTTLLSILGCILTACSGQVSIAGEVIDPRKPGRLPEIRRRSIGFVFQQYNLFGALTALENVEYALNVKRFRGPEARREAQRMLEMVGLADRQRSLPADLSGGQKQRVAIARALAGRPAAILADEPTANLDAAMGAQVLDLFRSLAKRENRALVIVTHDPRVRAVCDRVALISDGRVVG